MKFALKDEDDYEPPKNCKGTWSIPTGYEKIEISKCEGGVNLGPTMKDCPNRQNKEEIRENLKTFS